LHKRNRRRSKMALRRKYLYMNNEESQLIDKSVGRLEEWASVDGMKSWWKGKRKASRRRVQTSEADSSSASQEITCLLWKPYVKYSVRASPPLDSIL